MVNNCCMCSHLDILYIILLNYQKFLFYDASVSILKDRNYTHISFFYKLFMKYFIQALNDINNLETKNISLSSKYFVKDSCEEILNNYLQSSEIISDISDKTRDKISQILKDSALIKKENIKLVLFNDDLLYKTVIFFNKSYTKLYLYTHAEIAALLTEFHNALSHLITAIVLIDKKNNTDIDDIVQRNIDRAVSHFKRGTKDSYKIIIKAVYKGYKKYKSKDNVILLPNEFAENFIEIRSKEIIYLSNTTHYNNIHDSIKMLAEQLIKHFTFEKNKSFYDNFYEVLSEYIIDFSNKHLTK